MKQSAGERVPPQSPTRWDGSVRLRQNRVRPPETRAAASSRLEQAGRNRVNHPGRQSQPPASRRRPLGGPLGKSLAFRINPKRDSVLTVPGLPVRVGAAPSRTIVFPGKPSGRVRQAAPKGFRLPRRPFALGQGAARPRTGRPPSSASSGSLAPHRVEL